MFTGGIPFVCASIDQESSVHRDQIWHLYHDVMLLNQPKVSFLWNFREITCHISNFDNVAAHHWAYLMSMNSKCALMFVVANTLGR